MNDSHEPAEVLIAGAGPVGLLLANLLGQRGLRVRVVERRTDPPRHSMAIGITPPSLAILRRLGLDNEFVRRGIAIQTARVFESGAPLGTVDFSRIPAEHPFILSLPQSITIQILRQHLRRWPTVQLEEGVELADLDPYGDTIRVTLGHVDTTRRTKLTAQYLAGCDGHRSTVRRLAGIQENTWRYPSRFIMADFDDDTGLHHAAHIYFDARGSVEAFPLPGKRRRWITQTGPKPVDEGGIGPRVVQLVRERTGVDLSGSPIHAQSSFQPRRTEVNPYVRGRVALCGDAAHVMSPIGGQGMNTGFADAEHLGHTLASALDRPATAPQEFAHYHAARSQAFRVAANRAARGMWLGTRRGRVLSALRRVVIAGILFRPPIRGRLAPYFAMLTIPRPSPDHPGG